MNFIGYCVNKKQENIFEKQIKNVIEQNKLIAINNNSIDNIKNIKFETIIINDELQDNIYIEKLKKIIANAKYLVINSDNVDLSILQNINVMPITYGYNSKATLTMSSAENEKIMLCLQRSINNVQNKIIEPQEIIIDVEDENVNKYLIMCVIIINKLYE